MRYLFITSGEAGRTYECDTHGRSECGLEISKYIYGLPDEVIVLMIVWDSANRHYHDAIPAFQTVVGNTVDITNDLQEREAWALIGYKGILDVSWRSSKISGETQSPTFTRKTIPLLRGKWRGKRRTKRR